MAETIRRVLVDKDLRPAYYDDFRCLAQACRISCCKGWNITFNKKDYLSLKRQEGSGDLNARMETGLRRLRRGAMAEKFYGEFNMDSGVCPLLGEDGLCQLQKEKGHRALPHVCRTYPRGEQYMASGCMERSLSPSCEAVLELLWNLPEGIEFRSAPLPKGQQRYLNLHTQSPMPLWFPLVREWCVDLLQNRRFTLPQRIWLMGLGLQELTESGADIQRWVERAAVLPDSVNASDILPTGSQQLVIFLSSCVRTLAGIRSSDPILRSVKSEALGALKLETHEAAGNITIPLGPYQEIRARFEEVFKDRDYFMENLMTAVFFHLQMPQMGTKEDLWKGYVNFCNLYAVYRFLAVMSCREGVEDYKGELFRSLVFASRSLLHNGARQASLRDEFFQNDSASLAHMAILVGG